MHMSILFKNGMIKRALYGCRILLMILLLMLVAGGSIRAGSTFETIFNAALPLPEWKMEGQPYHYEAQNLYEYINGAAEFFIAYGFIELHGANYGSASGPMGSAAIDIYDMGNGLNAFGVFQARRNNQAYALNVGAASAGSDGYLAFIKDRFYIEMQVETLNQNATEVIATMASRIAAHLPGNNSLPKELSYLPEKGRVAGSERYIRGGILGHSFLDQGLVGDYRLEGETVSVFIVFFSSSQEAITAVEQHRAFLRTSNKDPASLDGFGAHSLVSEEPYHNKIIETQHGALVVGVYDLINLKVGKTLLTDTLKNLGQMFRD